MCHRRTILMLAGIILSIVVFAQDKITKLKVHPYLFYTNDRVATLKDRLKTDTRFAKAWQQMGRTGQQNTKMEFCIRYGSQ